MNMENKIKAVIVDVDQTLTDFVSWPMLTESLGADPKVHINIFNDFQKKAISYDEAKNKLIFLWQKTGKATRKNIEEIFDSFKITESAHPIIKYLKTKYKVCLISGSMDLFVKSVANKLDVKDWYANTQLIFNQEGVLTDFAYFQNQAEKKYEQFKDFASKNALQESDCAVIGDGDSDRALLEKLGLPILVANKDTPDDLKEKIRIKLKSLDQVKEIL